MEVFETKYCDTMSTNKKLIAVAGGTSPTLGTAIVNALAESKSCSPIIISRLKEGEERPQSRNTLSGATVPIRYVDYDNEAALTDTVKDIHTLICVIKILGPAWASTQISLLNAAKKAGVKHFAPSEFELGPLAKGKIDVTTPIKGPVWKACKESGLEVARFQCGGFHNAMPSGAFKNTRWDEQARKRIEEALHGLQDDDVMWSLRIESAHELVTDDGKSPRITLPEIGDVGRFVAAACELLGQVVERRHEHGRRNAHYG